jgi:hypothetical protein
MPNHRAALVQSLRGATRSDRRRGTVILLSLLVLAVTLVGLWTQLPTAPRPAAVIGPADVTSSEEPLTSSTLPLPSSEPPDAESAALESAAAKEDHDHQKS